MLRQPSRPPLPPVRRSGRANSYFEAVYSVGFLLGPAIAGLLSSTIGPGPTLAIDAVSFGLSGLALALVRHDLRAPVDRPRTGLVADIREGIDFIVGHSMLRTMILFWSIVAISTAPLVTALAVHITRDLGLGDEILGLVLTAYGSGTIVGSLLAARVTHRPVGPTLLGGTFVTGCMLLIAARTDQVPVLLGVAAISGIVQTMVLVTYITVRTAYSPDALLGRIGSTARTISLGLQPVGLLAGGALIDLTNGSTAIAIMGATLAVVSLLFVPVGVLRHATVQPRMQG